jgi:hypothetical protein
MDTKTMQLDGAAASLENIGRCFGIWKDLRHSRQSLNPVFVGPAGLRSGYRDLEGGYRPPLLSTRPSRMILTAHKPRGLPKAVTKRPW